MTRVQVLLTEEQDRRLEQVARRRRVSKASLVRQGVDIILRSATERADDAISGLVGQAGQVGRTDVARLHDAYLLGVRGRKRR
jgi:hypothetical protein